MTQDNGNSLPRLTDARLAADSLSIDLGSYPRTADKFICHIGPGAFHRAHQAAYLDELLSNDLAQGWGLCAINLRQEDSSRLKSLAAQDGLYTLWQADQRNLSPRIIRSVMACIDASSCSDAALQRLAAPTTRIVSLTITEAGYALTSDGSLDMPRSDIASDLAGGAPVRSAPGLIVKALEMRRAAAAGGVTLMSCDNLIANGGKLKTAILEFAGVRDPALGRWIEANCSFPLSMVDRITPAMTKSLATQLSRQAGIADEVPVLCEPWRQWILEDNFVAGRPPLASAGVVFTDRVHDYEQMKVGLLNGGHSAISHAGLLAGHRYVHEAMADPDIRSLLEAYWDEITPSLPAIPGFDVAGYRTSLIQRFANAALDDRLTRLAQDSSEKFRQVLLQLLAENLKSGRPSRWACQVLADWFEYLRRAAKNPDMAYPDPRAEALMQVAHQFDGPDTVRAFLELGLGSGELDGLEEQVWNILVRQTRSS